MNWRELLPSYHPLRQEPEPEPVYSFCESNAAYVWHIRILTARGQRLSGGADTPALCGMRVSWDIKAALAPVLAQMRNGRGNGVCSKCAQIYRSKP